MLFVFRSLLPFALARSGTQLFPIHENAIGVYAVAAILRKGTIQRHDHPYLHRVSGPARTHEGVRASHFRRPIDDFAGRFILHVDVKPNVGIRPFDLGDNSRQFNSLRAIEFGGERVMGQQWGSG